MALNTSETCTFIKMLTASYQNYTHTTHTYTQRTFVFQTKYLLRVHEPVSLPDTLSVRYVQTYLACKSKKPDTDKASGSEAG